jgi:SAM-dependent methyltransferase
MQHYYRDLISEYYDSTREPEDHIATSHGRIVNRVSSYVQHGSVMEVGCGYGFLLNMFSGDKWNRVGIEPSLYASSYAEKQLGLTVFRAELDYRMFEAHSFDAVLAFDLLEHLKDPAQLLALTKHYLAPHGLLVIGTGNISSFNARLFGHLWGYFGSWEHISFFSPKSMKYLLSKAGFDIVRCDLVSYWSGFFRNCTEAFHNGAVIVKNLCKVVWNATQSQKRKPMTKSRLLFDHMVIYARPRQ